MPADETNAAQAFLPEIDAIAADLRSFDPGALAALRRAPERSPAFWRMRVRHNLGDAEAWRMIVRLMALLTETGRAEGKASPHDPQKQFGEALCDGGEASWGVGEKDPKPMLSELRFARLLHARGDAQAALLERAVRMLAHRKDPRQGVDCKILADLLTARDQGRVRRRLADAYYRRLDRSARAAAAAENSITDGDTQ